MPLYWRRISIFLTLLDIYCKNHPLLSFFGLLHLLQVQAHGLDAMVDEENCVFFLPHRPRSQICEPPFFLFMKGTGNGYIMWYVPLLHI